MDGTDGTDHTPWTVTTTRALAVLTNADNHSKNIGIMNLDCRRWRFLSELGDE